MISTAILQGPIATPFDLVDNNRNGVIDEPGERCVMTGFQYYNNDFSQTGNPVLPEHYYGYMTGYWKDSTLVTYGGTGYGGMSPTRYMYPGAAWDTTGWSENNPVPFLTPNAPGDRRHVISSGPFTLLPGETTSIDYAYVFTREPRYPNGSQTSVQKNRDDVLKIKHWFDTDSFPCSIP